MPPRSLLGAALLAAAAGCGGYRDAPVAGRVTLDGKPLAGAWVNFQPVGGKDRDPGPGSVGRTDADGRYTLRRADNDRPGAVVGPHRVRISTRGDKAVELPDGGGRGYPDKVPLKYNFETVLTCDVPPGGKADADYELVTKEGKK